MGLDVKDRGRSLRGNGVARRQPVILDMRIYSRTAGHVQYLFLCHLLRRGGDKRASRFNRPYGTESSPDFLLVPAMNCWAIFKRPYGTGSRHCRASRVRLPEGTLPALGALRRILPGRQDLLGAVVGGM
jgi:hypothetical protein